MMIHLRFFFLVNVPEGFVGQYTEWKYPVDAVNVLKSMTLRYKQFNAALDIFKDIFFLIIHALFFDFSSLIPNNILGRFYYSRFISSNITHILINMVFSFFLSHFSNLSCLFLSFLLSLLAGFLLCSSLSFVNVQYNSVPFTTLHSYRLPLCVCLQF